MHLIPGFDFTQETALANEPATLRRPSTKIARRMVGREPILQVIRGMTHALVTENKSSLLMLSGHAGYGKTKLMHHLSTEEEFQGHRSNFHIFRARGTPELRPVPLTPWRTIIVVRCRRLLRPCCANDASIIRSTCACCGPSTGTKIL